MTRMAELQARRWMLIARCEAQRAELAQRLAQLHQQSLPARHPLAWIAALGALMLLGRTREVLKLLMWARVALSVAARVAQLLRLIRDGGCGALSFAASRSPPPAAQARARRQERPPARPASGCRSPPAAWHAPGPS